MPTPPPPKERATLKGHEHVVYTAAFSPDGRILASGSGDKTIKLWDVRSGKCLMTLEGHTGHVERVAFSPDGKTLASTGMWRTLRLWDVASGKKIADLADPLGLQKILQFSPDGKTIYTRSFWDVPTRKRREDIKVCRPEGAHAWQYPAYDPDGKLLSVFGFPRIPNEEVWDVVANKKVRELEHPGEGVFFGRCGAFSRDCKFFARAAHWLCVWDVQTGKLKGSYKRPGPTTCIAFSPDGKLLATGWQGEGTKGVVSIVDPATGKELATLEGHTGFLDCVVFSPDGTLLASCSGDFTIKLWDVRGVQVPKKD